MKESEKRAKKQMKSKKKPKQEKTRAHHKKQQEPEGSHRDGGEKGILRARFRRTSPHQQAEVALLVKLARVRHVLADLGGVH
eukprot:SAG22_NODE_16619_length_321_cov_1.081081_1_plen_81_part_10